MERIYGRTYNKKRLAPGGVTRVEQLSLLHDCTTLGGNSGSAVVDLDSGEALGLHFSGKFMTANYAVRSDIVKRLLADDMWSGWGVRTLSSDHPAYNPFSYQTGSVWPHDNAMIAGGFRRYGFDTEAAKVAKGTFDAADRLSGYRLPELFAGLPKSEASFPVQYPGANVPQAWAAGSVIRLIAILAGIHATTDASGSRIYVNPALPSWLPALTIRNLRAGGGSLDLVLRDGKMDVPTNTTKFEVIHGPAPHPKAPDTRA